MKKTLTKNISRYDNKIRLRYNSRTLRILLVSVLIGFLVGYILSLVLQFVYAVGFGAIIALLLMMVQLVEMNGMPLIKYIFLILSPPIKRQYEHTAVLPEDRLILDKTERKDEKNSDKTQKAKKESRRK